MTYRVPDAEAMTTLRDLLGGARHAALAFEEDGAPMIARVAVQWHGDALVSLVSDLAAHTRALRRQRDCALLIAQNTGRGDPLMHPRLSLRAIATFVDNDAPERPCLRREWLRRQPKSTLYVDFADFHFVRFVPRDALLNAGFGRAYRVDGHEIG